MCGIFGVSGKYTTTNMTDKFLRNCAIAGAVRGVDSTGMIFLQNDKKDRVTYLKKAVNGTTFIENVFNPVFHLGTKTHSVVGHNRAATVGNINDHTAHPFVEDNIVGVHNGTLSAGWKTDLQVSKNCDVDSRGLYRAVAARGIDWVVDHLYGAAALVWVDCHTDKTFVFRNSERPLHWATNTSGNTVWYASEKGMLEWLLDKSNIQHTEVQEFKVNTLYDITDGEVKELRTLPRATRVVNTPPPRGVSATASQTTYSQKQKQSNAKQTENKQHGTPITSSDTAGGNAAYKKNNRILPRGKGLRWQNGVAFRGEDVSEEEKSAGIIGEWAEIGFEEYECFCCEQPIQSASFLESTEDAIIKMHETCFDQYRCQYSADDDVIIIRRNEALRRKTG